MLTIKLSIDSTKTNPGLLIQSGVPVISLIIAIVPVNKATAPGINQR